MKTLLGAGIDPRTLTLLDEIRTLRSRVEELESALRQAEVAQDRVSVEVDVRNTLLEAVPSA